MNGNSSVVDSPNCPNDHVTHNINVKKFQKWMQRTFGIHLMNVIIRIRTFFAHECEWVRFYVSVFSWILHSTRFHANSHSLTYQCYRSLFVDLNLHEFGWIKEGTHYTPLLNRSNVCISQRALNAKTTWLV